MTFRYSPTLRNNQVSQIQTTVAAAGTTAMQLRIYSGAEPGNVNPGTEPSGTLCTITLPNPFLTSTGGVTAIAPVGGWSGTASATGTAVCWRIYDMAGTPVCHLQGSTVTDLVLNNQSITINQTVTVTSFIVTAGNQ
jgi:hypothetical protein